VTSKLPVGIWEPAASRRAREFVSNFGFDLLTWQIEAERGLRYGV
jgi:hypothetical protein